MDAQILWWDYAMKTEIASELVSQMMSSLFQERIRFEKEADSGNGTLY